jgi:hypothetical protein
VLDKWNFSTSSTVITQKQLDLLLNAGLIEIAMRGTRINAVVGEIAPD